MKTRHLLLLLAVIGSAMFWQASRPTEVSAAFNYYGRADRHTYYGDQDSDGGWVFVYTDDLRYSGISENWMTETMTADIFISEMRRRLYSPTDINSSRASGIINLMLGIDSRDTRYDGPSATRWQNGVTLAKANFATWEGRIRDYDAAGRVEWNDFYSDTTPLDWLGSKTYGTPQFDTPDLVPLRIMQSPENEPAIVFYNPDGTVFNFIKKCANLMGEVEALVGLTPPTALTCGAMTYAPSQPEVGDSVTVRPTVRYSGGPPTPVVSGNSVTVRDGTGQPGDVASTVTNSAGIARLAATFTVPSAGAYSASWSLTVNGTSISCGGTFSANDSFVSMVYPFFQVNGGDTVAGASFSAPNVAGTTVVPCSTAQHNQKGGVVSSNRNTQPDYAGAGGKYAVFAMNVIQSFASDRGNGRGATSLSFSNVEYPDDSVTSVQPTTGFFGGMFGSVPCVDYWGVKPPDSELATISNGSLNGLDGKYKYTGNLTIGNTLVQSGKRITIYVKGDVSIRGDIVYQNNSTSYASIADIPSFRLIVNGRIFVDSSVDQLDGLYVAVPNSNYISAIGSFAAPATGTISTCSDDFTSYNPQQAHTSDMISTCNNRLTVNGSFIANQLLLLRTFGTLRSNEPAEVFNYSPEIWLAQSSLSIKETYDSMSGLPPIL